MKNLNVLNYCLLISLLHFVISNHIFAQKAELLNNYSWRAIGPANMGGRVTDIDGVPGDPSTFYVSGADGGIHKTIDGGVNFSPIFENQRAYSIGALTVSPSDSNVIWVGTGEGDPRNSVGYGWGVYRSMDAGLTWKHLGLKKTERIKRIVVDPNNPDVACICALGKQWGPNKERGVFRTTDGGKTWDKILYIDENTGCADIAMENENPGIMYAGMWTFRRKPWRFDDGGKNTAIYKTNDGGVTWKKIMKGLPKTDMARPGIYIAQSDPNIVYLMTEFEGGGTVFRSEDKGEKWEMVNDDPKINFRPFYYSDVRVDPQSPNILFSISGWLSRSKDSGNTWERIATSVHGDHQSLWIDPKNPNYILNGSDGGFQRSFDGGDSWEIINNIELSQFYQIQVDNLRPYNVYGGLQDNGVWMGPHNTSPSKRWNMTGNYPWKSILGGDGMEVQIDNRNPNIVYTGSQFGFYSRLDLETGKRRSIKPVHELGQSPFRFNWQTPIRLSSHNQDVLYYGSNFLHKSVDKGDSWEIISDDLTKGGKMGNVPYGTLTTISESPLNKDIIYTGSDDGMIHVTKNGGKTWKNISQDLPQDLWVSKLYASSHEENIIYASLDGYRWDNFSPYLFKSKDYGKTWTSISSNLPDSPINVVIEDNINENILYVGNDHGVYASLDYGINWEPFNNGLNSAAVHDLVIQKDESHLLVGTHGRSIYLADIEKIQSLSCDILKSPLYMYPIKSIKKSASWGVKRSVWSEPFNPNLELTIFSSTNKEYQLSIVDSNGNTVYNVSDKFDRGFNFIDYDLKHNQNKNGYLDKGSYKVLIITDKDNLEKEFQIK